jgi:hypothetical protein
VVPDIEPQVSEAGAAGGLLAEQKPEALRHQEQNSRAIRGGVNGRHGVTPSEGRATTVTFQPSPHLRRPGATCGTVEAPAGAG